MISIRLSAIVLALSACSALAQEHLMGTLTVMVTDQSGAKVPGARIEATNNSTGARVVATTGADGQSVVHLDQGSYGLKVSDRGFSNWTENSVDAKAETNRKVTLLLAPDSGPIIVEEVRPELSPYHQELTAELPFMPLQPLTPTAKPIPRKSHWF